MATKKKVVKKVKKAVVGTALVKRDNVQAIERLRHDGIDALTDLAKVFSGKVEVAPKVVGEAYNSVYTLAKASDDILNIAKRYITDMLKATGEKTTDKGSRVGTIGDYRFEMRPTRTGFDPKKLEALIRTKGINPASYMETRVTYAVDEAGTQRALADGTLTADELESMRYPESFALQPPQVASGDEG